MSNKKSIGLVLVVSGFILIALTGIRTISNPELFTHIALGQAGSSSADPISYTMAQQNWVDLNPLYNKIVSALWAMGGAPLITLAHVAAVLAAFFLLFRLGQKWGGPVSQGLALLVCAWLLQPIFNPGPAAFALLFITLFVTLLQRTANLVVLAVSLLVLQVLWTNIHPSFLFGPVLILFFALDNKQTGRSASRVSMATPLTNKLLILSGSALLVTLANPNVFKLHIHILSNWFLLVRADSPEWISLFSSGFPQSFTEGLYFFTLILCAGGLITLQKKLPPMITMLALTGAALGVLSFSRGEHSVRALLAFSLLVLPFMILSLNAVSEYLTHSLISAVRVSEKVLQNAMAGVTLILMITTAGALITNSVYTNLGSASSFGLGVAEESFPVAAAGLLDRNDFPEKILNIAHDGGYLAVQNPNRKVFCDTRLSFYGTDFFQNLNRALLGQDEWTTIMANWDPHAVVLNGAWPNAGALARRLAAQVNEMRNPIWKLVYFDGSTIILVRDLPEYQTLVNDPTIQQYGLAVLANTRKKYVAGNTGLFKTGNSPRLIGAASIFLSLNRPAKAETIYRTITDNCPAMATAWLGLGKSLIFQKKLSEGIEHIERATQILPRSALAWRELYAAYLLKEDKANAAKAKEKLNRFYDADKATVEQQKEIAAPQTPKSNSKPTLPKELR